MKLFTLFTYNVEVQYKSYLLSKAMLFILLTNAIIIILPFIFAYGGRGFWLKSQSYFEQPVVFFTYDYLFVAETDDPSQPIVCGNENHDDDEYCAEFQVGEYDNNDDGNNDVLELKLLLKIPPPKTLASVVLLFGLDLQLKTICPLHMQGLSIITKEFSQPPSALIYYGDLTLHQASHLPCHPNTVDTAYNITFFGHLGKKSKDIVDAIIEEYFTREAIIDTKTLHSRSQNGHTGTVNIKIRLRIPETLVLYTPNLLQELKWAWPQYLSMAVVLYWIFNKIKKFVFSNRLLMAWEVVTWKKP
ncbi:transmembrane protein 231-like [Leguminivora glycinivorella]|uniref:transmembrane protein 231-like n=1 Tax=Leguminivora glycinivorella TaxID=1035111 RepID=UPI0020107451|nr:transmembrane protein 231-like [Leguminivora glycinivorella]